MNFAHVHLMVNHLPVLGAVFSLGLLIAARLRRGEDLMGAAYVAIALTALSTGLALATGEPAEEVIEHLPGVIESLIERHEEAALPASVPLWIAGAVSLFALVLRRRSKNVPGWIFPLLLLALLAGSAGMARVAALGGEIRHEEIRKNFAPSESLEGDAETVG